MQATIEIDCPSLWVADRAGTVLELDACVGATRRRLDTGGEPAGLALDPSGDVFVTDLVDASVTRWRADEAAWRFVDRVDLEDPIALALRGDLFVLARDPGGLGRLGVDGEIGPVLSSSRFDRAHDLAFGPDGLLYVAVEPSLASRVGVQVWDVDDGALRGGLGEELGIPVALVLDDDALLVADWYYDVVWRVPLDGGAAEALFEVPKPLGLAGSTEALFVSTAEGVMRWSAHGGLSLVRGLDDELVDPRALRLAR